MGEKFQNRYRIASTRLQNWDYGWDAAYFITICTKDRECLFGEIHNKEMKLSKVGVIAEICWYEIINHAKNVELGEYVVMPNHVHGVLVLNGNGGRGTDTDVETDTVVDKRHAFYLQRQRQRQKPPSNQDEPTIGQQRFQNQGKNTISSIIGGYKSAVSKHAHRLGFDMAWQSLFHDHIIRDEQSFHRITEYIKNNPANWRGDRFFN